MYIHLKAHKGVAMIELIFAIVVMAIVLMSAPNLIAQAGKSAYISLQQESVNAAASHINVILTKEWDQQNADKRIDSRLLVVTSGDSSLNEKGTTNLRAGTPTTSYRKFVTRTGSSLSASLSTTFGETGDNGVSGASPFDDIDDYNTHTASLKQVADSNKYNTNYKDLNITMYTKVSYVSDTLSSGSYTSDQTITFDNPFSTPSSGSTNIKAVSVTLTTNRTEEELDKNITLSAFMCNIGHYEFAQPRDF